MGDSRVSDLHSREVQDHVRVVRFDFRHFVKTAELREPQIRKIRESQDRGISEEPPADRALSIVQRAFHKAGFFSTLTSSKTIQIERSPKQALHSPGLPPELSLSIAEHGETFDVIAEKASRVELGCLSRILRRIHQCTAGYSTSTDPRDRALFRQQESSRRNGAKGGKRRPTAAMRARQEEKRDVREEREERDYAAELSDDASDSSLSRVDERPREKSRSPRVGRSPSPRGPALAPELLMKGAGQQRAMR